MDILTPEIAALLFGVGLLAGLVDSIAGGGGLLALPTLLALGLSPAQAIATNKVQGTAGSLSATINFVRKGEVRPREMLPAIASTFVGAALGAVAVQAIDPGFLAELMPVLLIGVALYVLLSPRMGDADARRRIGPGVFAATAGAGIGFYDGFFGPGTGTFLAVAFVSLLGLNLRRATAHAKVLNLTSNVASLAMFVLGGQIVWAAGLTMAAGQFLGARVGSGLVIRQGARLVRPMLVVASLAITAKLLLADDGMVRRGLDLAAALVGMPETAAATGP